MTDSFSNGENAGLDSGVSFGEKARLGTVLDTIDCRINIKKALKKAGLKRKRIDRLWARKKVVDKSLFEELVALARDLEVFVFEASSDAKKSAIARVENLYPSGEPLEVEVEINAPKWLDLSLWLPDGPIVSPRTARWVMHQLDGVWLDGKAVEVLCRPEIRPGKRPQKRVDERSSQRRMFSRWHEGVRVDEEGLYSLTPEALALDMVQGLSGTVVDGTCGVGGLAIAAARQPGVSRVVAVDVSAARLEMAKHNAAIYGVEQRIQWIHGRIEENLPADADALVLDPPWGGKDYSRQRMSFEDFPIGIEAVLESFDGAVRLKLPKSFLVSELGPSWTIKAAVDDRCQIKFLVANRL